MARATLALAALSAAVATPARGQSEVFVAPYNELVRMTVERCQAAGLSTSGLAVKSVEAGDVVSQHDLHDLRTRVLTLVDTAYIVPPAGFNLATGVVYEAFRFGRSYDAAGNLRQPSLMDGVGRNGHFTQVPADCVDGGEALCTDGFINVPPLWIHLKELHTVLGRMRYTVRSGTWTANGEPNAYDSRNAGATFCETWVEARDSYGIGTWSMSTPAIVDGQAPGAFTYGQYKTNGKHYAAYAYRRVAHLAVSGLWAGRAHSATFYSYAGPLTETWYYRSDFSANGDPVANQAWLPWCSMPPRADVTEVSDVLGRHGDMPEWCSAPSHPDAVVRGYRVREARAVLEWHDLYAPDIKDPAQYDMKEDGLVHTGCECVDCPPIPGIDWPARMPLGARFKLGVSSGIQTGGIRLLGYVTEYPVAGQPRQIFSLDTRVLVAAGDASDSWGFAMLKRPSGAEVVFSLKGRTAGQAVNMVRPYRVMWTSDRLTVYFPYGKPVAHRFNAAGDLVEAWVYEKGRILKATGSPAAWPGLTVERDNGHLTRVTSTTGVAEPHYQGGLINKVDYTDRRGSFLHRLTTYFGSRIYRIEDADGRVLSETRSRGTGDTWEVWRGVVTNEPASIGLLERRTRARDALSGALTDTESRILAPGTPAESSNVTVRVLQEFEWGTEVIEEIAGADGPDPQRTRYTYGTDRDDTNNWSRLAQVERPDGSWTRFTYDGLGRESTAVTPFGNAAPDAPDALCRVRRSYYAGDPLLATLDFPTNDVAFDFDSRPRLVIEEALGFEVARTYTACLPDALVTKTCPEAGAAYSAPGNLTQVDRLYTAGDHAGRPWRSSAPDGTLTTWAYDLDASGTTLTTVTESGAGDGVVTQGIRTVTIADDSDRTLSERTEDIATGLLLSARLYERDGYGRVLLETNTVRGTCRAYEYDCCGIAAATDEDGVTTFHEHDALKRPVATLRLGVREELAHDALGNVIRTTRSAPGVPDAVSTTTHDPAGRVAESRDAAGQATRYAYRTNSLGEREVTRTQPDGHTVIETYYRDGSLKSVGGTAAHPRHYAYGVDGSGPYSVEYAGADTSATHWVRTCTDRLGRPAQALYADGHAETNGYDALGRPVRRTQGALAVLTEFDARGEPLRTAIDMDGNGRLDLDGADRVTETRRQWRLRDGVPVEETLTFAYPDMGSAAPRLATAELRSADGARAWSVVAGRTNALAIERDPAVAARLETLTQPDGTRLVTAWTNGLRRSVARLDAAGAPVSQASFEYDGLGRLSEERVPAPDGGTLRTLHAYDLLDRETNTTHVAGALRESTAVEYDALGRVKRTILPDGGEVRYGYAPTGERLSEQGTRTYPVTYGYDDQGRLAALSTYRAGTNGLADTTRWEFDPQRGWPTAKVFADGTRTTFEYRPTGLLARRTWARGVSTAYAYDAAGSLTNVTYTDGTPAVSYTLDRLGRPVVIRDASGARTNAFAADGTLAAATQPQAPGLELLYDRDAAGRLSALRLAGTDHAVHYGYDAAGRLHTVTNAEVATRYDFGPEGDEVTRKVISHRAGPSLQVTNAYDGFGRLLRTQSAPSAGAGWAHAYEYDAAGLRSRVALGDGSRWEYAHDALGQLTSGRRLLSDGAPVAGSQFEYGFDTIGNRMSRSVDGTSSWTYQANAVNEYAQIVAPAQAASAPPRGTVFVLDGSGRSPFAGAAATASQTLTPQYDADGNLLSDGASTYEWDAENRLIAMETGSAGSRSRMTCTYDDQGRRIRKTLSAWATDHWSPVTDHRFLYDGWLPVAEVRSQSSEVSTNFYVWGLDLSGTLQGAGGIGGLLSMVCGPGSNVLFFAFDGSGNVVGLVDAASGEVAARYEYGPFGELIRAEGPAADSNPFRFSTKYADRFPSAPDSTLYYFGYRHYSPAQGRWLSRDPIGEEGGRNLFEFACSQPVSCIDPLGLSTDGHSIGSRLAKIPTGLRVIFGLGTSVMSGDALDDSKIVSTFAPGQCDFLLTINGISNDDEASQQMLALAQRRFGLPGVRVVNDTHLAVVGDLIQILGHEVGAIDITSRRAARQVNLMRSWANAQGCTCPRIVVVAHSQGTMVFKRALPLIDHPTRSLIEYHGAGGEAFIGPNSGLGSVENRWNRSEGKLFGLDAVPALSTYLNPLKGYGIPFHLLGGQVEMIQTPKSAATGKPRSGNNHGWTVFYEWSY